MKILNSCRMLFKVAYNDHLVKTMTATPILSWLLHHANRLGKNQYFYPIKNRILGKYGQHVCYDVQFIEGKECYSCAGTGLYTKHDYTGWYKEPCWNCYDGWYRRPTWNILAKVKFGKYYFHQPYKRVYEKPDVTTNLIQGYIDHTESKYSKFALFVLFLIYEKGYLKRWYREAGNGWRQLWYLPRNWIPCVIHYVKHGVNAYPIRRLRSKIKNPLLKLEPADKLPF